MTLPHMMYAIRTRLTVCAAICAGTIVAAFAVSLLAPAIYKTEASVLLNYRGVDPVSGMSMAPQLMPGYIATQIDVVKSKNVALRVVDALRLVERPNFIADFAEETGGRGELRDWIADLIARKVRVLPARDSSVIEISYRSTDPELATAMSNAFAEQYLHSIVDLNADPLKDVSLYFDQRIRSLRENVETAQARLSAYQQENGLVSTDSTLDVETERLNELSRQLAAAQSEALTARSRTGAQPETNAAESPDVLANPLVQNLKAALAAANARLARVQEQFTPKHDQFRQAKAEVDTLRAELNQAMGATASGIGTNAVMLERRLGELRTLFESQKTRVLALNRTRDQMTVLGKDADSARQAYDHAVQRFNQTSLESHANQPDASILSAAAPPFKPWFPDLKLNLMLAAVLGPLLGMGVAIAAEAARRRVHTAQDLVNVLQAPVLATFSHPVPLLHRGRLLLGPSRLGASRLAHSPERLR
jgi:polysaccharide biosynthesis transport protein